MAGGRRQRQNGGRNPCGALHTAPGGCRPCSGRQGDVNLTKMPVERCVEYRVWGVRRVSEEQQQQSSSTRLNRVVVRECCYRLRIGRLLALGTVDANGGAGCRGGCKKREEKGREVEAREKGRLRWENLVMVEKVGGDRVANREQGDCWYFAVQPVTWRQPCWSWQLAAAG